MTQAKINEHEPTAVKRDPSDQKIVEKGQEGTDAERAKGTAGAGKSGDEYEQGAAGTSRSSLFLSVSQRSRPSLRPLLRTSAHAVCDRVLVPD